MAYSILVILNLISPMFIASVSTVIIQLHLRPVTECTDWVVSISVA